MLKQFTMLLGIVLLGVGIWGSMIGGHDHVLVVFGVNMKHNAVHIASGVAAIAAAMISLKAAKLFCVAFGLVYGAVAVMGFMNVEQAVTMLNLNQADNYLHTAIAASCLWFGLKAKV